MGFICYECSSKLHEVWEAAHKEICRRLDSGEKYEDLVVEYKNERNLLLEAGGHDTERYWFLCEAEAMCNGVLGYCAVTAAGWMRNHSGRMVKDPRKQVNEQPTMAEIELLRKKLAAAETQIRKLKSRGLLARILRMGE